jgi:pSer/pThr/pTyr-binding forkhead associated (FHA) protein
MAAEGPVLIGVEGFVQGEEYPLDYGQTLIIGRSRSCDISLRRCPKWLEQNPANRDETKDFKTVSRKHVRVSFYNANSIEIEDLSSNGTFVDGKRVDRILISDIKERGHELLLGTRERFKLVWRGPK